MPVGLPRSAPTTTCWPPAGATPRCTRPGLAASRPPRPETRRSGVGVAVGLVGGGLGQGPLELVQEARDLVRGEQVTLDGERQPLLDLLDGVVLAQLAVEVEQPVLDRRRAEQ